MTVELEETMSSSVQNLMIKKNTKNLRNMSTLTKPSSSSYLPQKHNNFVVFFLVIFLFSATSIVDVDARRLTQTSDAEVDLLEVRTGSDASSSSSSSFSWDDDGFYGVSSPMVADEPNEEECPQRNPPNGRKCAKVMIMDE